MNKLIKKELNKCEHAEIPVFDDNTTSIYIPKCPIKKDLVFEKDHCYHVEIADYIVNPLPGFTLSINWNGGTNPPTHFMNISVLQCMGKMVKVEGVGVDVENNVTLDCFWSGWLPVSGVVIKKEI